MRELPTPTLPFAEWGAHTGGAGRLLQLGRAAARRPPDVRPVDRFLVEWATHEDDVQAAQRLRYQVFVDEMGAQISPPPGTAPGLDVDRFDAHCEHLIVRCNDEASAQHGEVIGTYRVLTPEASQRVGGWYSDSEFDLAPLLPLQERMAELGRSCVHPDHRSGGVILALWGALGAFLQGRGLETVVGCASVSMRDGGAMAASLWAQLRTTSLAPEGLRVQPRLALPVDNLRQDLPVEVPALIKGYLRCGAKVLGAPAWDPEFNTADLPMLIQLRDLPRRYQRHFLSE